MDVDTVLATLPDRPATLIRQVKLEGASVAEAAGRAGMSETAAKVAIHRGLKALAARFTGGAR
jgi:RNA polymerase sigma-70 factor (ECF subfamily)